MLVACRFDDVQQPSANGYVESLFFQLPAKFRGNRVTSYGGYLRFTLEFSARPQGNNVRDVDVEIIVSTEKDSLVFVLSVCWLNVFKMCHIAE